MGAAVATAAFAIAAQEAKELKRVPTLINIGNPEVLFIQFETLFELEMKQPAEELPESVGRRVVAMLHSSTAAARSAKPGVAIKATESCWEVSATVGCSQ